jgi:hypothetical protein
MRLFCHQLRTKLFQVVVTYFSHLKLYCQIVIALSNKVLTKKKKKKKNGILVPCCTLR